MRTELAGGSQIIYDFEYNARARELMSNSTDAAAGRFGPLTSRPGKIIAIHLSYASRADQRGRRPDAPSYFFKPSSSVAASGGTIERPAGTELLAFEGEIALVIGTAARRIAACGGVGSRRLGHRLQRLRPLRPARERQGLQRALEGRRRFHTDRAGPGRRARHRSRRPAAADLGERHPRAGRHDRGAASSPSRSSSPTSRSTSPSRRAMSSSPALPPDPRWSCRATSSRSRSMPPPSG